MARAPKHCARCDTLVTGRRYCDNCKPVGWGYGTSRTSTAAHKAWRKNVLDACGWRCQIRGVGCLGEATHADHITPLAEGGAEFDLANGQGACPACHARKTSAEAARGRARRLRGGGDPSPGGPGSPE